MWHFIDPCREILLPPARSKCRVRNTSADPPLACRVEGCMPTRSLTHSWPVVEGRSPNSTLCQTLPGVCSLPFGHLRARSYSNAGFIQKSSLQVKRSAKTIGPRQCKGLRISSKLTADWGADCSERAISREWVRKTTLFSLFFFLQFPINDKLAHKRTTESNWCNVTDHIN